jgi:hypothetical protein
MYDVGMSTTDITPAWAYTRFAAADFAKRGDHAKAQAAAFALAIEDGYEIDRTCWVARKAGHVNMKLVWNEARRELQIAYTWYPLVDGKLVRA